MQAFEQTLNLVNQFIERGDIAWLEEIWNSILRKGRRTDEDKIILDLLNKNAEKLSMMNQLPSTQHFVYLLQNYKRSLKHSYVPDLKEELEKAVKENNIEIVLSLLQKGADPEEGIYAAVKAGNAEILQLLYKASKNKKRTLESIITFAVYTEQLELLEVFQDDILMFKQNGKHVVSFGALEIAIKRGDWDAVNYLLDIVPYKDPYLRAGFLNALSAKHYDMADFFFDQGISQEELDDRLKTSLFDYNLEVARYLLDKGADLSTVDPGLANRLREDV
jgi:hypothetical protein